MQETQDFVVLSKDVVFRDYAVEAGLVPPGTIHYSDASQVDLCGRFVVVGQVFFENQALPPRKMEVDVMSASLCFALRYVNVIVPDDSELSVDVIRSGAGNPIDVRVLKHVLEPVPVSNEPSKDIDVDADETVGIKQELERLRKLESKITSFLSSASINRDFADIGCVRISEYMHGMSWQFNFKIPEISFGEGLIRAFQAHELPVPSSHLGIA